MEGDDGLSTGALNFAAAETIVLVLLNALQVGCNDLKLQAGASGVEDKNIHAKWTLVGSMAFHTVFREAILEIRSGIDRGATGSGRSNNKIKPMLIAAPSTGLPSESTTCPRMMYLSNRWLPPSGPAAKGSPCRMQVLPDTLYFV